MWKPKEQEIYEDYYGETYKVIEVPNTAGTSTMEAESMRVKCIDEDGDRRILPVIWWHKRRNQMEKIS